MHNIKAKSLRRRAEQMTTGQSAKFLIGTRKGAANNLYPEHAKSTTHAVYQSLKASS